MAGLIDRSIVRVFSADPASDSPVGVGFLVGSEFLVTCAHVVAAATGRSSAIVGDEVMVDFPMVNGGVKRIASVALAAEGPGGSDIAGLSVAAVPEAARVVRVVAADDVAGHRVQAFGTTRTRPDGVWSEAVLRHPTGGGVFQVEDERVHGVPIQPGFSGSPLIDLNLGAVIGMVCRVESKPERRVAYALSGEALHDACPLLAGPGGLRSPFRGLEPFQLADAEFFFGRGEYAERVAGKLSLEGICLVTGPSGSGKSSLVLAGVLPQGARDGTESMVFRPAAGSSPWHAFASSVIDQLHAGPVTLADVEELSERLRGGGLEDALNRVLVAQGLRRLTVVLDQFDEGFIRAPDASLELLGALLDAHGSHRREPRIDLVITLTTEALNGLLADQRFGSRLSSHVVPLGAPGQPELRAIIESPLAAVGMPVYEPGLAEVLVGDVREEGNPLPLLEFTLTLLWERQRRGVLTHQTYWELGGLAGALASYAEQVCGRYLASDSGTADLRWVLGQMVSPVGPDRVVRRVVELDQLGTRAELARELAASRLVTLGTTVDGRATVEIAHEALARHWPRFRTWVEQDRDFRAWQDELDRQAERWHGGPDKARLLRGKVLRDAQAQVRRYPGMLTGRQLAFLSASTRHQHARSFRVYLACVLVIVLAAALAEGTWFYVRQQGSVNAGNAAQSLLVQDQQQAGSSRPMESVALQVRAFRTDDDVSTRDLLHALAGELQFATAIIPGSFRYAGAQQPINANASGLVVMDPDGKLVAWNLAGRHPTSVVIPADPGPSGAALSVAWLGTDKLVTSYSHGPSVIWDAATGRVVGRLPFGGDVLVTDAAGQRIAYGNSGDRSLREVSLAHLRAAPQVIRLPGQVNPSPQSIPGQVSVTDVLPDGDLVVQTGANRLELADPGGTRNLPAPSGASVVQVIDGGANRQAAVACVTSGSNTILEARSLLTGALLGQYSQYTARGVTDCESEVGVLSADGRYLAVTTGLTSSVTSNSPVTNVGEIGGLIQPVPTPPGYDAVRTVAEPGGAQRVILEGMDSMLVLEVPPLNPMLHARQVAVSAQLSSKYLLLALPNGHVDAWDTTTLRETGSVTAAPPADADELQIAADPAGNVVATLDGRASTIRLWRLPVLAPIGAIHLATPAGYFNAGVQLSVSGTRLTVSQWQTRKTPGNNLDQPGRVEFSTWDVRTQRRTAGPAMVSSNDALANESDSGSFLVLNPGGTELVQDQDGSIRRILLSTGMVVPGSEITDNDSPRSLSAQPAIDASGRFLALAHGNVVEIWDMNSGQQVARLVIAQGFSVQAVSFGANPHILDIGITGPQSETADMVQAWDWEPLLGIPAWFGIKYSTISMVDDPPVSILDEANTAGFTPVTRSVDPRTWLAEICNAWYPNPLDTAVAGLPANSWTGSVCPGR